MYIPFAACTKLLHCDTAHVEAPKGKQFNCTMQQVCLIQQYQIPIRCTAMLIKKPEMTCWDNAAI